MKQIGYISTINEELVRECGDAAIYRDVPQSGIVVRPVFVDEGDPSPICYVDHRNALEQVTRYGVAQVILRRENIAKLGVPLYTHPSPNALTKLEISLECVIKWLEAGCDPKQAAEELKLNLKHLEGVRKAR